INTGSVAGQTSAIGSRMPNAFGLHDMLGNAAEWCEDWYSPYDPADAVDPQGPPKGDGRVFKGLQASYFLLRPASRYHANSMHHCRGFRVVREIALPPATPAANAIGALPVLAKQPPPADAPFDKWKAQEYQKAWAEYCGVPVMSKN